MRSEFTSGAGRLSLDAIPEDVEVVLKTGVDGQDIHHRVPPGQRGEVTVRLSSEHSGRLEVRVRSAEGQPLRGILVTAEHAAGASRGETDRAGRVLLSVPPGEVEVSGIDLPALQRPSSVQVPQRFTPVKVQVPGKGPARLELRAARGTGALRVLLPASTHYHDVFVLPGVHPWPASIEELSYRSGLLEADLQADCWSQPGSYCFRTILTDFSALVPGPYTVFARDEQNLALFRKAVGVEAGARLPVPVRFTGEEARGFPW